MIDSVYVQMYIILLLFLFFLFKEIKHSHKHVWGWKLFFFKHAEAQLKKVRAHKKKSVCWYLLEQGRSPWVAYSEHLATDGPTDRLTDGLTDQPTERLIDSRALD